MNTPKNDNPNIEHDGNSDHSEHPIEDFLEIGSITLAENIIPSKGIWSCDVDMPHNTIFNELIAVFQSCDLIACITIEDEIYEEDLISGVASSIESDIIANHVSVELVPTNVKDDALISYVAVYPLSLGSIPVRTSDIEILMHPKHGSLVAFDFNNALEISAGAEMVQNKTVQLRASDGNICTISKSSVNYEWVRNILYCYGGGVMPGYEHAVRIKYDTAEKSVDWSKWLIFVPERKMTL